MSHSGRRVKARTRRAWRPLTAVAGGVLVVLVGAFLLGRALGLQEAGLAQAFTGEVVSFADDGRIVCVEPDGGDLPKPFCDVFYVAPQVDEVSVGDQVRVRTVTSRDRDGTTVSGMLISASTDD